MQTLLHVLDKLLYGSLSFYWNETRQLLSKLRIIIQFRYRYPLDEALTLQFWNFIWMSFSFSKLRLILLNELIEAFFSLNQLLMVVSGGFFVIFTKTLHEVLQLLILSSG